MWAGHAHLYIKIFYSCYEIIKKITYLSIWAYMGGGRKSGRGTPIFGFQPLLYYLMVRLKFHHCSFFHFIFMTYYVLKCSKIVDFYGFLVHNFRNYKKSIFNTKRTLYKIFLPSFTFLACSVRPLPCFPQTDGQTDGHR